MQALGRDDESIRPLIRAVEQAEAAIIGAIGRECDALRVGRLLAARAIRTHLADCARMYIAAIAAARDALDADQPGDAESFLGTSLEKRRAAFAALLRVEMAALAAARQQAIASTQTLPPLAKSA